MVRVTNLGPSPAGGRNCSVPVTALLHRPPYTGEGASVKETPRSQTRKDFLLMRSDLIFGAMTHVNNRYKLCQLASKATRKLHKPNTRLQDTTNEVLDRFKETVPMNISEAIVEKVQLQERRAA